MKVLSGFSALVLIILCLEKSLAEFLCYECNSRLDPDCAEYDEGTFVDKYLVDCDRPSQKPNVFPFVNVWGERIASTKGCRKLYQEISSETTGGKTQYDIVRQCAYSGGAQDGIKRTGNKGYRVWYYQCLEPECNGGLRREVSLLMGVLCVLVGWMWRIGA